MIWYEWLRSICSRLFILEITDFHWKVPLRVAFKDLSGAVYWCPMVIEDISDDIKVSLLHIHHFFSQNRIPLYDKSPISYRSSSTSSVQRYDLSRPEISITSLSLLLGQLTAKIDELPIALSHTSIWAKSRDQQNCRKWRFEWNTRRIKWLIYISYLSINFICVQYTRWH